MPYPIRSQRPGSPIAGRYHGGRSELAQNFLIDPRVAAAVVEVLRRVRPLPVLELGAGDGALTRLLVCLGPPVTALEIDPYRVDQLRRVFGRRATVIEGDMLRHRLLPGPHHVVSNVPFAITTPLLRRLLNQSSWDTAVLLLQWEVARKRAGIGGTTMLTATWWPWYEFSLVRRVPARAFDPMPSVDGGILAVRRRPSPLVANAFTKDYQAFVARVFTGPGRGLAAILRGQLPAAAVRDWLDDHRVRPQALPRDLTVEQWVSLYRALPPG